MATEVQEYIDKIHLYKKNEQYEEAISICDEFISVYPDVWVAYREKADILQKQKDLWAALDERKKLAHIGSEEPSDYYDLVLLCLKLGENKEAVSWADVGIQLCNSSQNFYYYQSLNFHKAIALNHLSRYEESLACCMLLDDGFGTYVSGKGMQTKEDLMNSANYKLKKASPKLWKFD